MIVLSYPIIIKNLVCYMYARMFMMLCVGQRLKSLIHETLKR